ncbi:XVIPCD domain-containing protein [Stenotrophomonas sp. 3(2025)]|uniref:XVIPCD domain-containing protein n=1 Tax=Stenotrophomonas sp. 3(2025) TaxID=3456023 RepID=UPI0040440192
MDLRELGLDPRQLERNGLDLGKAKVFPIIDLGKDGYGRIELNNTSSLTRFSEEKADRALDHAPHAPRLLSAGDQTFFDQIRGKFEILDRANGRAFDETSERLSASLLAAAKDAGITRADHVLLSKQTANLPAAQNIFVVQGDLANPAAMRTHMATAEAAQRPVEESMGMVEAIGHRQAKEQAVDMQRVQEQQQRVSPPAM